MSMPPGLTPEQVREAVAMHEKGQSYGEIAECFNVSYGVVWRWINRYRDGKMPSSDDRGAQFIEGVKAGPEARVHSTGPNEIEITNTPSSLIHTLDQLLEYCNVDLDEWVVKDREVTAWPGWRKDKKTDLRWVNGVANGYVLDTGGIVTHQLIRVFARLVRRNPIPVFPHIQPIVVHPGYAHPPLGVVSGAIKRTLLLADLHVGFRRGGKAKNQLIPFHDRVAMDAAYRVAKAVRPDEIVILGDNLDLPDWSIKYHRSPDVWLVTQPAMIELAWFIGRLRSLLPLTRILYIKGNHEVRFTTMIETHLPAAYGLKSVDDLNGWDQLSIPKLLALDSLGVEYIDEYPNGSYWINPDLEAEHGNTARKGYGDTSKAIMNERGNSVASGHIHRPEVVTKVDRRGGVNTPIQAICPGCLCRLDGEVPGHDPKKQDWAHGVAIINTHIDTGFWNEELVRINYGVAIAGGLVIEGESYIDELRSDYPEWGF